MRKNDDIYYLLDNLSQSVSSDKMGQEEFKFTLFLKSRELKQISVALQRVMLKSREDRQRWVDDNQKIMESLVKVFSEDSALTLTGMQMDEETTSLSIELANNLKKTVLIINTLFYDSNDLMS